MKFLASLILFSFATASFADELKYYEKLISLLKDKQTFASWRTQDVEVEIVNLQERPMNELATEEMQRAVKRFSNGEAQTLEDLVGYEESQSSINFGFENRSVKREFLEFITNDEAKKALRGVLHSRSDEALWGTYFGAKFWDNGADIFGDAVYIIFPQFADEKRREAVIIRISFSEG